MHTYELWHLLVFGSVGKTNDPYNILLLLSGCLFLRAQFRTNFSILLLYVKKVIAHTNYNYGLKKYN